MYRTKLINREVLFRGKVFDIIVDSIEYPSGNSSVREVVKHPGGAVIVPLIDDDNILLIRQHRYPIDEVIYELPAGKLSEGESPEHCARRELEEETGYTAKEFIPLTAFYTTPGFCTERLHIYLATGLQKLKTGQNLEEGEASITIEKIPLKRTIEMIESGKIVDGKTIVGLFLAGRKIGY